MTPATEEHTVGTDQKYPATTPITDKTLILAL